MTEWEYQTQVVARRIAAEQEEKKHDCINCQERVGVPCLKVYKCEKMKEGRNEMR